MKKQMIIQKIYPALFLATCSLLVSQSFVSAAHAVTAKDTHQQTFASATDASEAFKNALQGNDQSALLKILGDDSKDIISSGDEVEDKTARDQFVKKYGRMHRLVTEPDGTTTLYIGAENWPAPIPLMKDKTNHWYFDTANGRKEILYRRIGDNELTMIQICHELVDAENEYKSQTHDGGSAQVFAQKIISDPGKHNGLFWKTSANETESPLGPFIASAEREGYEKMETQKSQPFHGYYFKVLKSSGFAFLAYPAEYRSSGVMSFLVDQDGVVYEKDLGKNTQQMVQKMSEYKKDSRWRKADSH